MLVTEARGGGGGGAGVATPGGGSTPGSATPSLLDSPTLARVERARLRQERGGSPSPLRAACCQSLTTGAGALSALPSLPGLGSSPAREMHALKRGLLWQQRDRLFSRWKERYFILTRDYLHCFKRASGSENRISDMGQFIFKVKLVEVERVEWVNRRTYSAVVLTLGRDGRDGRGEGRGEGRVLLRANDGLEDWFELLEECTLASKERRQLLRKSHDPNWSRADHFSNFNNFNNNSVTSNLDDWLISRHKLAGLPHLSDSVPDLQHLQSLQALPARARGSHCSAIVGGAAGAGTGRGGRGPTALALADLDDFEDDDEPWLRRRPPRHEQRLSLLTDIDINSCDMQLETPPPSVPATFRGRPTSYRLNNDVFFMSSTATSRDQERLRGTVTPSIYSSRSVLTPVGSFRSTHLFNPTKQAAERYSAMNDAINFRDRSQSDAHRLERPNWKSKADSSGRRSSCLVQATQV